MPRITKKEQIARLLKEGKIRCGYCKPNQNENRKKGCKHFAKGWKDKTKQERQFKTE